MKELIRLYDDEGELVGFWSPDTECAILGDGYYVYQEPEAEE